MLFKLLKNKYIILTFLFFSLSHFDLEGQLNERTTKSAIKMAELFSWIDGLYVDTIDLYKFNETIIRNTLSMLDPHSQYISRDEVRAMNEPLEGSFDGIGVSFNILNDTVLITSTINGGPSEKIGILAGDRIITVNGENIAKAGIQTRDVFSRLRGVRGTEVEVGVLRRGTPELLSFRIVRDRIPLHSIDAAYKVTDDIGYIKLSRFSATSKREFDDALRSLKAQGTNSLILDLTGNTGGYIDVAVQLTDEFLDRGQLVVYTEGENSRRRDYRATARGEFKEGNVVVMIDENSASASEILAGALQDWDRGMIVGRRSFGKGLVQRSLNFSDSSMVRLTVARYYTPTGRAIQKPYNSAGDEYSAGTRNVRLQTGELTGNATNNAPDSLMFQTLIKKRAVFGGGGITPDVFVPIDTTFITLYYRRLVGQNIFNRFMLEFIDKNRHVLLRQYPTFERFDQRFVITDEMLNDLQEFAQKEGLARNEQQFEKSKEHIEKRMKGTIARDLWETSELYEVMNRINPIFLRAIKELENKNQNDDLARY
jgi:carboxyl-terminal processing protease